MAPGAPTARRGDKLRLDVLLAVVLLCAETLLWVFGPREFWPRSWPFALCWLAVTYVAVALRRTALRVGAAIFGVQLIIAALLIDAPPSGGIPLLVVTYTAAATLSVSRAAVLSLLLWLPAIVIVVATGRTNDQPLPLPPMYFVLYNAMALLACFFIGRTVFNRRAYVAALEDRARTAEGRQQAVADQAVAEERRRIARELHDVVAHHVSVMGVLATGTRRALLRDPAAADEALATIEETGRVALREMRRLLTVLRTDTEPAGELEPQPGLPGLDPLLEQVREAGLPVHLVTVGEADHVDAGIALAVYRITQEALTNALKHAGPASAEVRLTFAPKELAIEISDTGRGPHPGGSHVGHGLLGMRERISLYGGTLRTGPRPGGGYRVVARIPREPELRPITPPREPEPSPITPPREPELSPVTPQRPAAGTQVTGPVVAGTVAAGTAGTAGATGADPAESADIEWRSAS
jgi:signal transduction histidine kinase